MNKIEYSKAKPMLSSLAGILLPDISINRNESDIQIFNKVYDQIKSRKLLQMILMKQPYEKSTDIANVLRNQGNAAFKKKCFIDALIYYHKSLCEAPRDSVEYGLAIANRSAVLFALNKFKECLSDINTLLRAEYPDNLKYKIFIRQSKCFMELKMYTKARTAIKQAGNSFKANKTNNTETVSAISSEIQAIKTKLDGISESDALPTPEEHFPLPELKNGENPNYAYASKDVTIRLEQKCVVADADISKGDVLFVEEPYAYFPDNEIEHATVYCHHCFKSTLVFIPCVLCKQTYFCSDECRQICWNSYHKWVCFGLRLELLLIEMEFALNVVFRASYTGLKTVSDNKSKYGDKKGNYSFIYNLPVREVPAADLKPNALYAAVAVLYLESYTDYFQWLYAKLQRPEGSLEDLRRIIGSFIFRHINQVSYGKKICGVHFQEQPQNVKKLNLKFDYIGFGLYVSSTHVKVSCEANTIISYYGNVKVVKATKFIKKGTEITALRSGVPILNICFSQFEIPVLEQILNKICITCVSCDNYDEHMLRFQIWLCKKCSGQALPVSNTENAKCVKCKNIFSLEDYKKMEQRIEQLTSPLTLLNKGDLDLAFNKMKRIYHEDNLKFCEVYRFYVIYYRNKGEFVKSVDYAKLLIKLYKKLGDTHDLYVGSMYQYSVSLIHYCITLRSVDSPTFKKYYDEAKKNISITSTLLRYRLNERTVHYLTNILNDYLESNNIEHIKEILLRHIL